MAENSSRGASGRGASSPRRSGIALGAADLVGRLTGYWLKAGAFPFTLLPGTVRAMVAAPSRRLVRASAHFPKAVGQAIEDFAEDLGGLDPDGEAPLDEPGLHTHRDQNKNAAILFVHGFGQNSQNTWGDFPSFLVNERKLKEWDVFSLGYVTSLWVDLEGLWAASPPIDKLARQLHTVARNPPLDRYQSVAIVAHSMGGLVTQRALVDFDELESRVSHVVLYGTPSNGIKKAAWLQFWKRQIRDMKAGGAFITDLRRRWDDQIGSFPSFELMAFAGDEDEFVPASSSLGPFPSEFQGVVPGDHSSMVNPASADAINVQALVKILVGEAAPVGPWNSARVAIQNRHFQNAIEELLPHQAELDDDTLVLLALALDSVNRQAEAVSLLEQSGRDDTDVMGTLAGRLKRRWLTERRLKDAKKAQSLYQRAFEVSESKDNSEQAYYHAINAAFMALAHDKDRAKAREYAGRAIEHANKSEESHWSLATLGEAHLLLGQGDKALEFYRRALATEPDPWKLKSSFQQAIRVAELLSDRPSVGRLRRLFRGEDKSESRAA